MYSSKTAFYHLITPNIINRAINKIKKLIAQWP